MQTLKILCGTYNVGTSSPESNLNDFLHLNKANATEIPDIYVLSFQEVKSQPQDMMMYALFDDPWTYACIATLKSRNYVKIKSIRLQGLVLSVFCLRKHLRGIMEIETQYTRTGLFGMWGNKGAVSLRLKIYGCSLCFINSHLSAHDEQLKDRIEDYNAIVTDHEFHVEEQSTIFFHDYVFWMGDLNFRLLEECGKSPEEIEHSISQKQSKTLFQYDQLRTVMLKGDAFSELKELDPPFPPTFKYEVGTNQYDHKRRPAWCDRILYKVNQHNYENITLNIEQLSYAAHQMYLQSDHKPVTADFKIKVFSDPIEYSVEFNKINTWYQDEENIITYRIRNSEFISNEDWIGLYKADFASLDDYITYEYVTKETNSEPNNLNLSTNPSNSTFRINQLVWSELPNRCDGKFCVIYISQTEHKVTSFLGISEPFTIRKRNEN